MTTLEVRVTTLEHEMKEVRRDGVETRELASGASEDTGNLVAKLDAHKAVLQQLRTTQLEHGKEIASLRKEVAAFTTGVDSLQRDVRGIDTELRAGFARMTALLTEPKNPAG